MNDRRYTHLSFNVVLLLTGFVAVWISLRQQKIAFVKHSHTPMLSLMSYDVSQPMVDDHELPLKVPHTGMIFHLSLVYEDATNLSNKIYTDKVFKYMHHQLYQNVNALVQSSDELDTIGLDTRVVDGISLSTKYKCMLYNTHCGSDSTEDAHVMRSESTIESLLNDAGFGSNDLHKHFYMIFYVPTAATTDAAVLVVPAAIIIDKGFIQVLHTKSDESILTDHTYIAHLSSTFGMQYRRLLDAPIVSTLQSFPYNHIGKYYRWITDEEYVIVKQEWYSNMYLYCIQTIHSLSILISTASDYKQNVHVSKTMQEKLNKAISILNSVNVSDSNNISQLVDAYKICSVVRTDSSLSPVSFFEIEQYTAVYAPYWVPILIPLLKGFTGKY